MEIPNGYHALPQGKIAAIVTYLEMTAPPALFENPAPEGFTVEHVRNAELGWYRGLFRRIGEDWLWFSRLVLSDSELRAIIDHPSVDLHVLKRHGTDAGLLELDRRVPGEVELAFFGLTKEVIGKGAGRYLMGEAIRMAWAHKPSRFWLHTCTLDSPQALGFYQKAGFRPYKRAIEVADDPRLTNKLPREVASWFPVL